jgi:hypothetical protein
METLDLLSQVITGGYCEHLCLLQLKLESLHQIGPGLHQTLYLLLTLHVVFSGMHSGVIVLTAWTVTMESGQWVLVDVGITGVAYQDVVPF